MSHSVLRLLIGAVSLAAAISPVSAHHEITAKFDPDSSVELSGRVTWVDWANPHAHVFMAVEEAGDTHSWYVELESPAILELNGWDRDTLKPGDFIRVEGIKAWDGSPQVWGNSIVLSSTGQPVLGVSDDNLLALTDSATSQATPLWPDGQPRLGPPPGESGYWIPTSTVMVEDGVNVEMDDYGLLNDLSDASQVAPFKEWALSVYQFRQRNNLRFDPIFLDCKPPSGPRKFLTKFGIQLLEDRPFERIFVIAGGGNHDWQLIYTDGRTAEDFEVDSDNQLYYGRAVGAWEDDTLVVETEGFNEKFWLPGGVPHTYLMHTTERLTRTDFNTMTYEVTINDPGAYTRPWASTTTLKWLPGEDPREHYCQDNRL